MQLLAERDPQEPVDLKELKSARFGSVFPIIRCINNKDITNTENWASCILKKVRKETWEVLNVHQNEKVEDDLDLVGDDGLNNTWGLYYKGIYYKNDGEDADEYVTSFVSKTERDQFDKDKQDLSPKRKSLRKKATENVCNKAASVTKKALAKSPTSSLKLGDIVLVPLSDVDCTKVDGKTIAGVIVSINKDKSTCRVAVKQGLLHRAYVFHALRLVPEASNNRKVMDLEDAYKDWQGLPKITEREAARFISSVGGQGMVKCNCKGDCNTTSCACKKAGRLCSSRCHRNSKCCKNNSDD
jgi:ribosomal protein S17